MQSAAETSTGNAYLKPLIELKLEETKPIQPGNLCDV